MGYGGNGLYGFDTVTLGSGSDVVSQTHQVVAGIADPAFWLGTFGLGPKPINLTTFDHPVASYMSDLVSSNMILGLSWGYTAGASYNNKAPASLTLGGYDTNRFEPGGLMLEMNGDNSRPLQVAVQKILALNVPGGSDALNLLPTPIYEFIDSTLPHIWLPSNAVDAFVVAFGLTYDNTTDLFLINDTMRERNLQANPTLTFQLGTTPALDGGSTANIVLPYAAFDLQASYPFYQNATNYFPIRRAANDSQYTIGRTFLQEAYLIADFDRGNFTVAQAAFQEFNSENLVAIERPAEIANTTSAPSLKADKSKSTPPAALIAGVVIGATAVIVLSAVGVWLFLRRDKRCREGYGNKMKKSELPSENTIIETAAPHKTFGCELDSSSRSEIGSSSRGEVTSPIRSELANPTACHEAPTSRSRWIVEAPGNEPRFELVGSMRGDKGGQQLFVR